MNGRDENLPRVRQGQTIPPSFKAGAFHCIFCLVYTNHVWRNLKEGVAATESRIWVSTCRNCLEETYWIADALHSWNARMIYPADTSGAPAPHIDLPDDARHDYMEAASILGRSPRGAGALLRLALQKLMPHLGEKDKDLNDAIASLVKRGLDPGVQQALDALRVIGNNAVHPLELDLRDDTETVGALFGLINYIVEQRISHPKKLDALYQGLPEGARAAIARRDTRT
jgi:Domain of unknown function (DUF4145)